MSGYAASRPYSDVRFTGAQHYHRPAWGVWHLWFMGDALHAAQAFALTGLAATFSSLLPGVRVLQQIDRGTR